MTRRLELDVFDTTVHLATRPGQFVKLCQQIDDTLDYQPWESVGTCQQIHVGDGKSRLPRLHIVIGLDVAALALEEATPVYAVRTCAHEAAHAAGFIAEYTGHEPVNLGQDEVSAYLTAHIAGWLWSHLPA